MRFLQLLAAPSFTAVVAVVVSCSLHGCHDCLPGECEECVGETCEANCVEPDDEDIGYTCLWGCSDGADCSLTCDGVDCNLACSGSTCECEYCDARCTEGSTCRIATNSRLACDASSCEQHCVAPRDHQFSNCTQACTNGSSCSLTCGGSGDDEAPGKCRMSCDATSTCHLECNGQCSLCCNGSPDCVLDCPTGGQTCDDGTVVCGVVCGADF